MKHFSVIIFFCIIGSLTNNTPLFCQYRIVGSVNNGSELSSNHGVHEGSMIILNFLNFERIDTTYVQNNQFVFTGKIPYPSIATIDYEYGGHVILLDSAVYEFDLTLKNDGNRFYYDSEISTKSDFYTTWLAFLDSNGKLEVQKKQYISQLENNKNNDSILILQDELKKIDITLANHYWKFTNECPNKYVVAFIAPGAPDFSYDKYHNVYESLPDSVKNTFYGKNFSDKLTASRNGDLNKKDESFINSQMPEIIAVDSTLQEVILDKSFYQKYRYTIIDFWASWCGPCRKANVDYKALNTDFKKQDITIIGFSLDKTALEWKRALKEDNANWLHISDLQGEKSPIVNHFQIYSIPANLIIDSSGKIVGQNISVKNLKSFFVLLTADAEKL